MFQAKKVHKAFYREKHQDIPGKAEDLPGYGDELPGISPVNFQFSGKSLYWFSVGTYIFEHKW